MVRKKAKPETESAAAVPAESANGKRKAEDELVETGGESPKKARVEEEA